MALYRATARQREAKAKQKRLLRLQRARTVASRAANLLRVPFGATRILLFGSLVQGQVFHQDSDIDMAVGGIRSQDFWRAWSALDAISAEFEIDLVPIETASPRLSLVFQEGGVEL